MSRVSAELNLSEIPRPRFVVTEGNDDGSIWVGAWIATAFSDPVARFDVRLSGAIALPFIWWSNRRWDRAYARQQQEKEAHG